ncbi:response regulator transcription factor [Aquibacillus rhizosphaerae]|uniref:Response regulator n=1 Tax=Aquibacillus rhizosphaerae TaxID=3051431 RepID=A0ABT7L1R9_9BACI|nr:response regulator [Aquibacillus sp. LR5S19]MDL4839329.1 response regulator [Aquibacillus sp. LR5S19]
MYKVLLVDDERTILEGISAIVDWESQGVVLSGTARNGIEALEFISKNRPDIVISDITMPGLDGIQLVEKSKEDFPEIKWIFLSGFSEFEYARKAMRFGVKHYLLKPCNENAICQALGEVVREIEQHEMQNHYLEDIESKVNRLQVEEKEQLLKKLITDGEASTNKMDNFIELLGMSTKNKQIRMVLFYFEGAFHYSEVQVLKDLLQKVLGDNSYLADAIVGDYFIVLLNNIYDQNNLIDYMDEVKAMYQQQHDKGVTIVISEDKDIKQLKLVYNYLLGKLENRFYLGKRSLITPFNHIEYSTDDSELYQYDEEKLTYLLKAGNDEEVKLELIDIFANIESLKVKPILAKSYLTHLYLYLAKKTLHSVDKARFKEISKIDQMDTLQEFRAYFESLCFTISDLNKVNLHKYSSVVVKMIEVVKEHMEEPILSLQWVANEKLFMNPDYLGKMFKKEVGQRFSSYVTKVRIEKAVEIIEQEEDIKVFELAERLGFGSNPQYFSQIFKRITGCTPSDIIKSS